MKNECKHKQLKNALLFFRGGIIILRQIDHDSFTEAQYDNQIMDECDKQLQTVIAINGHEAEVLLSELLLFECNNRL